MGKTRSKHQRVTGKVNNAFIIGSNGELGVHVRKWESKGPKRLKMFDCFFNPMVVGSPLKNF